MLQPEFTLVDIGIAEERPSLTSSITANSGPLLTSTAQSGPVLPQCYPVLCPLPRTSPGTEAQLTTERWPALPSGEGVSLGRDETERGEDPF